MSNIHIQIFMPHSKKLDDMVDSVIIPGIDGDFEVQEGHTPFITRLRPGTLRVYKGETQDCYAMHDGFVTVEDNKILILSELCEGKGEIDPQRAEAAKTRAEKRISSTADTAIDFRRAETALKKAIARLDTLKQ